MPARPAGLVNVRSQLADYVLLYLKQVIKRCESRLCGSHQPPFWNVAHRIKVLTEPLHPACADPTRPEKSLCWNDKTADRFFRAIIIGNSGSGKTWLLSYEARRLASQAYDALWNHEISVDDLVVPIFLKCIQVSSRGDKVETALVDLTVDQMERSGASRHGRSFASFKDWMWKRLCTGGSVVLLDALDDVPFEHPKHGLPVFDPAADKPIGNASLTFARNIPVFEFLFLTLNRMTLIYGLTTAIDCECFLLTISKLKSTQSSGTGQTPIKAVNFSQR